MGRLHIILGTAAEGQYRHATPNMRQALIQTTVQALQAHPPEIPAIPHSDTVALRLAQCLNPTLPSGVHQKALEVYDYIFSNIGVCLPPYVSPA